MKQSRKFHILGSYGEAVITSGFDPEVRGSTPRMTYKCLCGAMVARGSSKPEVVGSIPTIGFLLP